MTSLIAVWNIQLRLDETNRFTKHFIIDLEVTVMDFAGAFNKMAWIAAMFKAFINIRLDYLYICLELCRLISKPVIGFDRGASD